MEEVLRTQQHGPGQAFKETSAGGMMLPAMWEHTIRGRSWDDITARHGLVLTTDLIHFNRRGAEIISGVIEGWLRKRT